MRKKISVTYFIFLGIAIFLMLTGLIFGKTNVFSHIESTETRQIYPREKVHISELEAEYYFDWRNAGRISDTLEMYSSHQAIYVYADGTLIYAVEGADSLWGSTNGAHYNFVQIPVGTKELKVVCKALYEEAADRGLEFFVGEGIHMYRAHIKDSIGAMLVSLLSICMGGFLVIYYLVVRKKVASAEESLFFGVFAVVLGLWTFQETNVMTLLIANRTAASFCGYMLLMICVVPFVLFVKSYMESKDKYIAYGICMYSLVVAIINTLGHMTGLWYFKKTVISVHAGIVMGVLYLLYTIVQRYREKGLEQKVALNLLGATVLILAVLIDVSAYYMNFQQTDIVGRIGLVIYIILLGVHTTMEFFAKIDEGRKAEIYKELAKKDGMTGLYNRNAFDEWEFNYKKYINTMLITFDLNNLKQCNDTKGHAVGDKYIIDAAALIQEVFGKVGKCYRIGGDEFCVVVERGERLDIDWHVEQLIKAQAEYNQNSEDVDMKIACGYAIFEETDLSMETTRSRADARMYSNKREIKGEK